MSHRIEKCPPNIPEFEEPEGNRLRPEELYDADDEERSESRGDVASLLFFGLLGHESPPLG